MSGLGLNAEECRVLGCLVEKERATPQQYPLSLNALTLACNQSTNRDPVVAYEEHVVQAAVTALKERGLARFVHPSHGRSALRFRHVVDEELGLDEQARSVLAVLLLRGPQTPGELRSRTERMAPFPDVAAVESVLDDLAARPAALVARLGRQPGQKEDRYAHLLGDGVSDRSPLGPAIPAAPAVPVSAAPAVPVAPAAAAPVPPTGVAPPAPVDAGLAAEVARLRAELEDLRRDVADLRRELGA